MSRGWPLNEPCWLKEEVYRMRVPPTVSVDSIELARAGQREGAGWAAAAAESARAEEGRE